MIRVQLGFQNPEIFLLFIEEKGLLTTPVPAEYCYQKPLGARPSAGCYSDFCQDVSLN